MGISSLDSQTGAAFGGLAADSHSLDSLRRAANRDPSKAVNQVATQFEALFLQSVLKSMREATMKSGLLDSSEQQTYQQMLDAQIAQTIAQRQGTGLSEMIARQLRQEVPQAAGTAAHPAANPAAQAGAPGPAAVSRQASAMLQTLQGAGSIQERAKNAVKR